MSYRLIKHQHPEYKQHQHLSINSVQEEFGSEFGDPNSIKYYEILSGSNRNKDEKQNKKNKDKKKDSKNKNNYNIFI